MLKHAFQSSYTSSFRTPSFSMLMHLDLGACSRFRVLALACKSSEDKASLAFECVEAIVAVCFTWSIKLWWLSQLSEWFIFLSYRSPFDFLSELRGLHVTTCEHDSAQQTRRLLCNTWMLQFARGLLKLMSGWFGWSNLQGIAFWLAILLPFRLGVLKIGSSYWLVLRLLLASPL